MHIKYQSDFQKHSQLYLRIGSSLHFQTFIRFNGIGPRKHSVSYGLPLRSEGTPLVLLSLRFPVEIYRPTIPRTMTGDGMQSHGLAGYHLSNQMHPQMHRCLASQLNPLGCLPRVQQCRRYCIV